MTTSSTPLPTLRRWQTWAHLAWLLALMAYVLAGTPLVPLHGDESTIIMMSKDYDSLFIRGDLSLVRYTVPPINAADQYLRLVNGVVSKYLIGLAWHLRGYGVGDLNDQYDWGADWNYNVSTGRIPAPDLLLTARWSSALLAAAGVPLMFALGWMLGGARVAYLASLYYTLHPALLLNGRRAVFEAAFTCFSLLTVLAGIAFLRLWSSAAARPLARGAGVLALGVTSGLAFASKHTALFVLAAVFIVCGFSLLAQRGARRSAGWGALVAAGALALAVFLLLNPAWWDNPLARGLEVLAMRRGLLAEQIDLFGGYAAPGDALVGAFRQIFVALPQYYEVNNWAGYIAAEIARYEQSPLRGVASGGSLPGAFVLLGFTLLGLARLLRGGGGITGRMVVGWALMMVVLVVGLTPLEWQRYYLPIYPPLGLLAALGVTAALDALRKRSINALLD